MKLMKIKPNDILFFRDGKPFDAGENMWMGTSFMPNPSVFYGAIFSAILAQNSEHRNEILNLELEQVLELGKVYIYDEENKDLYMSVPLDLFKNDRGFVKMGRIKQDGLLYFPDGNYERVNNQYIKVSNFKNSYTKGMAGSISIYNEDKFYTNSYKVGIKKSFQKSVEKDYLYRIDLMEFKGVDWNYAVEYCIKPEYIKLEDKGTIKLGGEGKSCKYEILDGISHKLPYDLNQLHDYENEICPYEKAKMILLSPGIYMKEGWRPSFENSSIKFHLGITDKPLYIGGFDLKKGKAKPMYRAVVAGSIYILESEEFKDKRLCEIKDFIKASIEGDCVDNFRGFNNFEIVGYGGQNDE